MAGGGVTYYRNHSSSDAIVTYSYSSAQPCPSISDIGWSAPEGKQFKEWNSKRDGSGVSMQVGTLYSADYGERYAIWESTNEYKIVDSTRLDSALTATANAILSKTGGSSAITWDMDEGFVDAIEDISTGTDVSDTTAAAGDVRTGKYFYTSAGVKTQGTIADQAAQTITPTTSDQTIASGKYLTGAQTIKGDANLVAGNIKNGTTIFGVTGTYSGGGGGGNIKRIAGNGMNSAVNVSGWSIEDFNDANVIDANDPKFLIAHITVNNTVYSFSYSYTQGISSIWFVSDIGGNRLLFVEFTVTKTRNNIDTISLTYKSSASDTIGAWEIISNLPTYTPPQGVSFTLILKDYDGYGTDYEVDVSNYEATTWNDLVDDIGFETEYQISIVEDSDNSAAVFDTAGLGANMLIHNSDDPNDDYTLVTDAIIDGHTYYAYYYG